MPGVTYGSSWDVTQPILLKSGFFSYRFLKEVGQVLTHFYDINFLVPTKLKVVPLGLGFLWTAKYSKLYTQQLLQYILLV